ncbi:hypothetical protein MASR2M17_01710 [Aminivibrio sp.]
MRKISVWIIALLLILLTAFWSGGAETVVYDNYSGFLKDIQKTPTEIHLFTGGGEKTFPWIMEKTLFLDESKKEITPLEFLIKFKNKGVTLLFEKGKVVEVSFSLF